MKIFTADYIFVKNSEFKKDYGILVDDGVIVSVEKMENLRSKYPTAEVDIHDGEVLIPGAVNGHHHCFQSLIRGLATDKPFLEWRDKALYRYSPDLSVEDTYNGALFSFAEMMKRGVTCVGDFFYLHNYGLESDEAIIRAAKSLGIRLCLNRTMYDWDGAPKGYVEDIDTAVRNTETLYKKYKEDQMVNIQPAPHSLHAASLPMIAAGMELAQKYNSKMHIHLSEEMFEIEQVTKEYGGLYPLEVLDREGLVNEHLVIIHGVYMKKSEIETLGRNGGGLVYCPSSNMFLADGITDIPEMIKSKVKISLGTDGACGNNRNSVFEEMRMTALLQKASTCDAQCINYEQVFEMGTESGGDHLGFKVGKIEEGFRADLVGVDLNDLSMLPISEGLEQMLPNIVYSMEPTAIKTVIINGIKTVMNREIVNVSEEEIRAKVKKTTQYFG